MKIVIETTPRYVEMKAIRCQPQSPGADHLITVDVQGAQGTYIVGDKFHLSDVLEFDIPFWDMLKSALFGHPLQISPDAEHEKL